MSETRIMVEFVGGPRDGERIPLAIEPEQSSLPVVRLVERDFAASREIGCYRVATWLTVPKGEHGVTYYRWHRA